MTIDERLERLTGRHEALSQTVEILAAMHRETEQQIAESGRRTDERFAEMAKRHDEMAKRHDEMAKETAARFAETAARFAETLVFINRLAHVAEAHETRLDDLEGPE